MDKTKFRLLLYGENKELVSSVLGEYQIVDLKEDPDYEFSPDYYYLAIYNETEKSSDYDRNPYQIIREKLHLGIRGENHHDLTKMKYLMTSDGIVFKFIYNRYEKATQFLTEEIYEKCVARQDALKKKYKRLQLKRVVSKKTGKPVYIMNYDQFKVDQDTLDFLQRDDYVEPPITIKSYEIIRDSKDIDRAFDIIMKDEKLYGLDYETDGFPMEDKKFYHMGVSITGIDGVGFYFDMEWMDTIGGNFDHFRDRLRAYCEKYYSSTITYNVGFEMRATHLLLKKLYLFEEGGTINKLNGIVSKNYSLKYTAMKDLGVASWDDKFSYLTEALGTLMNGKIDKKDDTKTITPTLYKDYESSPIWMEVCKRFPETAIIAEFRRLFSKYYGRPYKCIPAPILGEYCCKDSYYTVLLKKKALERYSETAWNCYNDNLVLGAIIDTTGMFIGQDERKRIEDYSLNVVLYGKLNVLKWYLDYKISILKKKDVKISEPLSKIYDLGYDPSDIKSLMTKLLDADWESGINETEALKLLDYDTFSLVKERVKQELMKKKTVDKLSRSRKMFSDIQEILDRALSISELGDSLKVVSEINSLKYQLKYISDLCTQISLGQWDKTSFKGMDGIMFGRYELTAFCDTVINVNSNDISPIYKLDVYHKYKDIIKGLLDESQLTVLDSFETEIARLIDLRKDKILACPAWDEYLLDGNLFKLFWNSYLEHYCFCDSVPKKKSDEIIAIPEAMAVMGRFVVQVKSGIFKAVVNHIAQEEADRDRIIDLRNNPEKYDVLDDSLEAFAKLEFCYYGMRKYNKVLTTYVNGQFLKYNYKSVFFDEEGVSDRMYEGEVTKSYPPVQVNQKKSKMLAL
jgi:hypothetical protein